MDITKKFLGGKLTCRNAVKDKMMPNGQLASWGKALVVEVGKSKLTLGKDFIKKLNELVEEEGFREWFADLPE